MSRRPRSGAQWERAESDSELQNSVWGQLTSGRNPKQRRERENLGRFHARANAMYWHGDLALGQPRSPEVTSGVTMVTPGIPYIVAAHISIKLFKICLSITLLARSLVAQNCPTFCLTCDITCFMAATSWADWSCTGVVASRR